MRSRARTSIGFAVYSKRKRHKPAFKKLINFGEDVEKIPMLCYTLIYKHTRND